MTGTVTAPRLAALEVLRMARGGELADRALDRAAAALDPRDHAWVQELVYGTFRLRGRLDYVLDGFVRGGLERLEPDALDILRLGAYQLLEMGSVPPYAAISQSVELSRAAGMARVAGLVNAVLQSLQRARGRIAFPDPERKPLEHLSTWGSHPRWLVERWVEEWGVDGARALVEADNLRPELFLRPVGVDAAAAVQRLRAAGLEGELVGFSPDSVRLAAGTTVREALAAVPSVVQDPAAALVVRYAAIPVGARVLDLCSAPGGKAMGMADGGARVAAADLSVRRLRRLRENTARLGLVDRVDPVVADGRHPPFRPTDAVLLDVPCSGTGTLRRHPDGRWRLREEDVPALAALQAELLDAAAGCVLPGGLLVYSTCALEREENEEQVRRFLGRRPEFRLDPSDTVGAEVLTTDGFLSVLPQSHGVDGSFAARMRRVDGA